MIENLDERLESGSGSVWKDVWEMSSSRVSFECLEQRVRAGLSISRDSTKAEATKPSLAGGQGRAHISLNTLFQLFSDLTPKAQIGTQAQIF